MHRMEKNIAALMVNNNIMWPCCGFVSCASNRGSSFHQMKGSEARRGFFHASASSRPFFSRSPSIRVITETCIWYCCPNYELSQLLFASCSLLSHSLRKISFLS